MRIKDIVSIGGMAGLYKIDGQKPSGLIVTSLTEGWTKFVSNRQHMFSPLENISIYTDTDNVELADVLLEVNNKKETNPPADTKADNAVIREWFTQIVPNHDQEKVYISDIKKLIKWFDILDEHGVIAGEIAARKEEAENSESVDENNKEESVEESTEEEKSDK
ncbi:MAG: DUF5606 domain-containing protein [Chitinophagales bacterium]|nr:DUF5606 domain-containing protein [Bacteroidota bacterium]MBK8486816.1 DUF5606 domain-containing protein [Bacteroidota bacterium]MBK8681288.1 DUF5606 domain-containing protein [Bacteroidota bacterium]